VKARVLVGLCQHDVLSLRGPDDAGDVPGRDLVAERVDRVGSHERRSSRTSAKPLSLPPVGREQRWVRLAGGKVVTADRVVLAAAPTAAQPSI
jgi:hypothetical protein